MERRHMQLIDTHAHLEDVQNLKEAITRAEEAGVIAIITMGSSYRANLWALRESRRYEREGLRIYPALGVHPWNVNDSDLGEALKFVKENVDEAYAVGEIGLDYWYRGVRKNPEKRELQRRLFVELLELARDHGKPVSIHSRGAWRDCVDLVIKSGIERAVFHWFSGPQDALEDLLRHGYYVSATPAVAYSREHRRVVMNTPLDRLLLETDSPVEYRGVVSEPAHLLRTLSEVAILKGAEKNVIAKKTTENARRLFRI
ncbi:hypothetical protein DRO55_00775 [Candidatus Bathyarchaeota archaeon]|nr:MAG: hypothetical protein DRO55_00775 [Candidatus Bathyarchaeota archaeon]